MTNKFEAIKSFKEFLKGSHINSGSDLKYLPKELLEKIWFDYAATHLSDKDILDKKLLEAVKIRVRNKGFLNDKTIFEIDLYGFFLDLEDLELLKFLLEYYPLGNHIYGRTLLHLASNGNLELMKYILSLNVEKKYLYDEAYEAFDVVCYSDVLIRALGHDHIHIASWLFDNVLSEDDKKILRDEKYDMYGAYDGFCGDQIVKCSVKTLEWAHSKAGIKFSAKSILNAIMNKQINFDVLNWLKNHYTDIDNFNTGEYLPFEESLLEYVQDVETIEWLIENMPAKYVEITSECYTHAFRVNNSSVINWFLSRSNRQVMSTEVITDAANSGNLSLIIWFFACGANLFYDDILSNNKDLFRSIILSAAYSGHLHVIKWASKIFGDHENTTSTYSHALNDAIERGHTHVALWLKTHKNAKFTSDVIWKCSLANNAEALKFITDNDIQDICSDKKKFYTLFKRYNMFSKFLSKVYEWLLDNYSTKFKYDEAEVKEFIFVSLNSEEKLKMLASRFHDKPNFWELVEEVRQNAEEFRKDF